MLELAKIENMRTQHEDLLAGKHVQSTDDLEQVEEELEKGCAVAEPEKEYGIVTVCEGKGMEDLFRELGADGIVTGGQTMNPSTDDILKAVSYTQLDVYKRQCWCSSLALPVVLMHLCRRSMLLRRQLMNSLRSRRLSISVIVG